MVAKASVNQPYTAVNVAAEACFLMSKTHGAGPAEAIALARKGVYGMVLSVADHVDSMETLMKKHADRPTSLADVCVIRSAEIHREPRILTVDADFRIYRWARTRKFQILE